MYTQCNFVNIVRLTPCRVINNTFNRAIDGGPRMQSKCCFEHNLAPLIITCTATHDDAKSAHSANEVADEFETFAHFGPECFLKPSLTLMSSCHRVAPRVPQLEGSVLG